MNLSEYACESLTFSGLGAQGSDPAQAAEQLALRLNEWVAANPGRRLLHASTLAVPTGKPALEEQVGLATLLIHTAGDTLSPELAEQVAMAIDDALDAPPPVEVSSQDAH